MEIVKIAKVEDILYISEDVKRIEIEPDVVMQYIYHNRDNYEAKINIVELRNVYAKSVNKSYAKKMYKDNIYISLKDVKKICRV